MEKETKNEEGTETNKERKIYAQQAREKRKKKEKDTKNSYTTKEDYKESEFYKTKWEKIERRTKWKEMQLEEVAVTLPAVVIDLGYADFMNDKINHLYGSFKKFEKPLSLTLCGVQGDWVARIEQAGGAGWKIPKVEKQYYEVYSTEQIVYLSPDSPNVLLELDEAKVYIIGGLVDQNQQKLATEKNLCTARLPLVENCDEFFNKSLNPNHVYEILVDYSIHGDWKKAFLERLPTRRGFRKREAATQSADSTMTKNNVNKRGKFPNANDEIHSDAADGNEERHGGMKDPVADAIPDVDDNSDRI